MSLELTATLKQILPIQSGQGKNGPWQKQDFIIETPGAYPKLVCCTMWGDKVNMLQNLSSGQQITVFFDVESREYNSRWYTDVKAWKIETKDGGASSPANNEIPPPNDADLPDFGDEDLPF